MAILNLGRESRSKDEASSVVNASKTLLANIRFMDVDNPLRTIAITSAVPNEGKTFVAANLASAIATSGRTVLLVEGDMRRRSMSKALGVHAQHGIYSVMAGEVSLGDAVVRTPTPNLYFLDSEPRIPTPSDLINSKRFSSLIERSRAMFDYVVFDTPPVGAFIDAAVLGTKVDAVLMVVRENFTRKAEMVAAVDQLRKAGVNLAGIVMNYCDQSSGGYYYNYYYSYYYNDPKEDANAPQRIVRPERSDRDDAEDAREPRRSSRRAAPSSSQASIPVPKAPPARPQRATSVPEISSEPELSSADQTGYVVASGPASGSARGGADDTSTFLGLADQVAQAQRNKRNREAGANLAREALRGVEDEF